MSATVTVDREALQRLLFEVDSLSDVEYLRLGDMSSYANHILGLVYDFRQTIDPREKFDEVLTDDEWDSLAEVRGLHARHLYRTLVIEDMLSHA
jgi:hypothetical protein